MQNHGPYRNRTFAIATMHAKERAVARPLRRRLGAELIVARDINTDLFGTFTGEVARQGTMIDAARAKAHAAIDATGLPAGLGSEGSFGPHPALPFLAAGREILLLCDRKLGFEVHEVLVTHRTNYQSRTCRPGEDIIDFLRGVRFPSHAVVVSANTAVADQEFIKGITCPTALAEAIRHAAGGSRDGLALITTDMRAHLNPTRMAVIRALSARLAGRLATLCPGCGTPGFGITEIVRGLPCGWCGEPTPVAAAELWRCSKCGFERRGKIRSAKDTADPGQCAHCNP
jgi:ribosomal protein L37E